MRSVIKTGLFSLLSTTMVAGLPTIAQAQTELIAPDIAGGQDMADSDVADDCQITFEAPNAYLDLIDENGFNIDDYENFCPWMNNNALILNMYGDSGLLKERAFASVQVALMRKSSRTTSPNAERLISLSSVATDEEAEEVWLQTMDQAINYLAEDKADHLEAIEAEEARLKAYWQAVE